MKNQRPFERRGATPLTLATGLAFAAALGVTACSVGPNFQTPAAPVEADPTHPYTEAPMPARTASAPGFAGEAQQFAGRTDIPADWWQLFGSPPLDALIRSALERSPTLAAAQAALRQADENYAADAGSRLLPAVSGQLSAERERASAVSTGFAASTFNLYNASIGVSYTVDTFGSVRRELEGLKAAVDYQRFQVEAAYLSLTGNLVTTAIQEASLRAQLDATQEIIAAERRAVELVQTQARLGGVARGSVLTLQAQLAQTQATVPAIVKALEQNRQQLAAYSGRLPSEPGLPTFTLSSLRLPLDLPTSLASDFVRQRPDIRASEALLHEASAQVGVATANLYPSITLSGSLGSQALTAGNLFSSGANFWSLTAGLTQPIFNGGALQARKRAAIAAFDQARFNYRQTVLSAFVNVASALRALDNDAEAVRTQELAASLARQSFDLVTRQYKLGAVSYLNLLDAQRTYQQTRVALVQAQAARYADTAALFQALGGGWWARPPLDDISTAAADPLPTPDPRTDSK